MYFCKKDAGINGTGSASALVLSPLLSVMGEGGGGNRGFSRRGGGGKKSPPQLHGADKILFYSIMKALDCEKDHVYSLLYRLSEMFNF